MTRSRSRPTAARLASPAIVWLLTLAVALGALHGVQPLHLHHGDTAAFYNEEHVLAALDTVTGEAPLPETLALGSVAPAAGDARLPADVAATPPNARLSGSRAPPLA